MRSSWLDRGGWLTGLVCLALLAGCEDGGTPAGEGAAGTGAVAGGIPPDDVEGEGGAAAIDGEAGAGGEAPIGGDGGAAGGAAGEGGDGGAAGGAAGEGGDGGAAGGAAGDGGDGGAAGGAAGDGGDGGEAGAAGAAGAGGEAGVGGGPDPDPPGEPIDDARVATAGEAQVRFNDMEQLPDGRWLVAGGAPDLGWLSAGVPRAELPAQDIESGGSDAVGFLLVLSSDFGRVLGVSHFPPDSVADLGRVRVVDGAVYVSGRRTTPNVRDTGYFVARLSQSAEGELHDGVAMVYNARGRPRQAGGFEGESHYRAFQPWDVGLDGRIILGIGSEYDFSWAAVEAVDADGERMVVPEWPAHWIQEGGEWHGPAAEYPDAEANPIIYSAIVLKAGRRGSLRSRTLEAYEAITPDGNGGMRQGSMPDDYYFSGPCEPSGGDCPGGPGYTGYRTSDKPTQRLGGIVIDRRNGDMYIGYSTQSRLPDGNPDFEPAVAAFDANGRLKWWSRLYTETDDNSTPDQYVDGLAIDYANDRLVVVARCHGNNVVNLWPGDQIAADPEARGFQNGFTGNAGNIHISWLGKLDLVDGTLRNSTYVAELSEGLQGAQPFGEDHPFAGQANPNAGWANLNTTRCRRPKVDGQGRVYVACTGRRTLTTPDAWQRMPNMGEGAGSWNEFARVYSPDLRDVVYSTLLTGDWDRETGQGGGNTYLGDIEPMAGGLAVVGYMRRDDAGELRGVPVVTANAPDWAGEGDGLFGLFPVPGLAAE